MHQPFPWTPESMEKQTLHKLWHHCGLNQWCPDPVHPHSVAAFNAATYCCSPWTRTSRSTHPGFDLNRPILWQQILSVFKQNRHAPRQLGHHHPWHQRPLQMGSIILIPTPNLHPMPPGWLPSPMWQIVPTTWPQNATFTNTCTVHLLAPLCAYGKMDWCRITFYLARPYKLTSLQVSYNFYFYHQIPPPERPS